MADIELVIKIPEDTYNGIKKNGYIYDEEVEEVALSIIGGTPLPKGHGDLIDRRELIKSGVSRGFCDWYDEIKYAETIIKADKEDE